MSSPTNTDIHHKTTIYICAHDDNASQRLHLRLIISGDTSIADTYSVETLSKLNAIGFSIS